MQSSMTIPAVFDVFNPMILSSELQSHSQWSHNILSSSLYSSTSSLNQTTLLNSSIIPHTNSTTMNSNVTLMLFLTSFSAMVEVVIACSIGGILVFAGILTPERVQFLSQLIFTVFSPIFNLHALSRAISIDSIYSLWMLPIINFINTILGNIIGRIVFFRKLWRGTLSEEQQQVQFVTQTFNNGVTIPLVFMSAICKISAGTLFDIEESAAVENAMAYINVYTLPSIFLFWSYGVMALTPPSTTSSPPPSSLSSSKEELTRSSKAAGSAGEEEQQHLAASTSTTMDDLDSTHHHHHHHHQYHDEDEYTHSSTELKDLNDSFIHNTIDIEAPPKENEEEHDHHHQLENTEELSLKTASSGNDNVSTTTSGKFKDKMSKIWNGERSRRLKFILKQTINLPVIALILGTIIGLIPPVKEFLITNPPKVVSAFVNTLSLFASGIFPISMVILGANVAMTLQVSIRAGRGGNNAEGLSRIEKLKKLLNPIRALKWFRKTFINFNNPLALIISIVIKLGIMPLLGVGIVYLGTSVLKVIPPNPILILTILVEWSVPMAMATTTLSSINKDYGQRQICELLLFNYILAPITLSLYCWWFLNLCCQFTQCLQ